MVKDLVTGLMWERYASSSTMSWQDAITYCTNQNIGEFSGWRLPAIKELATLLNYNITTGNLMMNQEIFIGELANRYWSSTSVSGVSGFAWDIIFNVGYVVDDGIGDEGKVRCVCSGSNCLLIANWSASTGVYEDATNQTNRYKINNDVVIDTFSNLQWERMHSNITMSWLNATYYCGNRTTGKHEGWRLPAALELQSLVDYTVPYKRDIPGINGTAFPNTPLNFFWSATPVAGYTGKYWYVSYGKDACYAGLVYSHMTDVGWSNCASNSGYVRCVYGNTIPQVTDDRYDTSKTGVVKDLITGLIWERYVGSTEYTWKDAVTHCVGSATGNISGWRLPTPKELATLLNHNIIPGGLIMNQNIFSGELIPWCWSGSADSGFSGSAWRIAFNDGHVGDGGTGSSSNVRCVYSL